MVYMVKLKSSAWQVAEAKASFSALLASAHDGPQIVQNRANPVAVVLNFARYQEMEAAARSIAQGLRLRTFLDASAAVCAEGDVELCVSARGSRPSPFAQRIR